MHSFGLTFRPQAVSALTNSCTDKILFSHNSPAFCTSAAGAQTKGRKKCPFSNKRLPPPCPSAKGCASVWYAFQHQNSTAIPLPNTSICCILHVTVQKCKCFLEYFSTSQLCLLKEITRFADSTHECRHELKWAKSFSNRSSARSRFGSFRISFLLFSVRYFAGA